MKQVKKSNNGIKFLYNQMAILNLFLYRLYDATSSPTDDYLPVLKSPVVMYNTRNIRLVRNRLRGECMAQNSSATCPYTGPINI
jgi:hypothetical protein